MLDFLLSTFAFKHREDQRTTYTTTYTYLIPHTTYAYHIHIPHTHTTYTYHIHIHNHNTYHIHNTCTDQKYEGLLDCTAVIKIVKFYY